MAGKLTERRIKAALHAKKNVILSDGDSLFLEITEKGAAHWRFRYRFNGKANRISLGDYKIVSLSAARELCRDVRSQLSNGNDPSQLRKERKKQQKEEKEKQRLTYADVVNEWFAVKQSQNVESTQRCNLNRIKRHILPTLGSKAFCEVTQDDQLAILRELEERDILGESKRVCNLLEQIGAYAQARKWSKGNIAFGLKQLIKRKPKVEQGHFPAITELEGVREMLRKIDFFCADKLKHRHTSDEMRALLRLFPLTGLRGNELAGLRWEEVDFTERKMTIPVERCQKTKKPFTVYLSDQSLAILQELYKQRHNGFVFRSRGASGHIITQTINNTLHLAGIPKGEMCNHGWRSVMLTLGHNYCHDYEAVELSASHTIGNAVAQAYNRGNYEARRRAFIQWYADFLDALKNDTELPKYVFSF